MTETSNSNRANGRLMTADSPRVPGGLHGEPGETPTAMEAPGVLPGDADARRRRFERMQARSRIRGRGPFGFSRKTWPFIKVLVANSLFGLLFFIAGRLTIQWTPASWDVADRLSLIIQCAIPAAVPAVIAIAIVAAQRLDPEQWVGQRVRPNSALDINTRFIQNTFEQLVLFIVGLSGLALYVWPSEASAIPVLTALFLTGRATFWVGYHRNPYVRAFGFGLTFYPTLVVYGWLLLVMAGIHIPI